MCSIKLSFDLVLLASGLCLSFPFSASRCKEWEASAVAQLEPCPPPWHCPPIKVLVGATSSPAAQGSSRERCLRQVRGQTALLNKSWSSGLRWCWFGVKFSDRGTPTVREGCGVCEIQGFRLWTWFHFVLKPVFCGGLGQKVFLRVP